MKIGFPAADPVREVAALSQMDKIIWPLDFWDAEDWLPCYKVFWIEVDGKKVGTSASGRDMYFSRSKSKKSWNRLGSLYLATTGLLPEFRSVRISNAVLRWQIKWAMDRGWEVLSTNCRKSDEWYLRLCRRFGFQVVDEVPYFVKPKENTVVLELRLR